MTYLSYNTVEELCSKARQSAYERGDQLKGRSRELHIYYLFFLLTHP